MKAEDLPEVVERMLRGYLSARPGPHESFHEFTKRYSTEQLKDMFAPSNTLPG
ncbi:MAG: hypothetical protein ACLQU5_27650 [Isosphaeraceae bacterium]